MAYQPRPPYDPNPQMQEPQVRVKPSDEYIPRLHLYTIMSIAYKVNSGRCINPWVVTIYETRRK